MAVGKRVKASKLLNAAEYSSEWVNACEVVTVVGVYEGGGCLEVVKDNGVTDTALAKSFRYLNNRPVKLR